ncbi:2907_t:CDS:1, partial [Gigaspora rosea]
IGSSHEEGIGKVIVVSVKGKGGYREIVVAKKVMVVEEMVVIREMAVISEMVVGKGEGLSGK